MDYDMFWTQALMLHGMLLLRCCCDLWPLRHRTCKTL